MFSIIIPLYNKQNYVGATIRSVLGQSYSDFEVIVVNDSSTDDSLRIVQEFDDERIGVHTIPNGGVSVARNYGIARASREYVCFLDADDLWSSDYLETLRRMILSHPGCSMYGTSFRVPGSNSSHQLHLPVAETEPYYVTDDYCKMVVENGYTPFWTSAVCAPRKIFARTGGFAEGVAAAEDLDMWLRLGLSGRVCYCNRPLVTYMTDSENNFRSRTNWDNIFPYGKWYSYAPENVFLHQYASKMLMNLVQTANRQKEYRYSLALQKEIRGSGFLFKRIVYYFLSTLKISL